ncbi:hypothetical protein [Mycobacterium marseillense]|uniref:hypothetical protein n=1 Tax=Mycobacterium marseillense TaxID=701042 RepID=UPI001ABFDF25|nr:hypothetical protein [Mycobacterium marseillense]
MTTGAGDPSEKDQLAGLFQALKIKIWPMLTDRSPITKSQREQALGYDAQTGI